MCYEGRTSSRAIDTRASAVRPAFSTATDVASRPPDAGQARSRTEAELSFAPTRTGRHDAIGSQARLMSSDGAPIAFIDFSRPAPFNPPLRRSPESARARPESFPRGADMRKTIAALLVALAGSLLALSPAHVQATRTWVSGVGDDANPCSRTAPCKTFAGAISKTAAGGVINVIDNGAYGTVTIIKAITIQNEANFAGILSSGTTGIIVNAGASDSV